jgi:DNA-binding transcriptional LysR family regulator
MPWTLSDGKDSQIVPVTGTFIANNPGMLRKLAISGVGIISSTEKFVENDLQERTLTRVLPKWSTAPVTVYAITETRLVSAKVRVFLDYLSEYFAKVK